VDDAVFSYNEGNRQELEMKHMFHRAHQLAAPVGRQATLFGQDHQVMAPGTKSAVSEYILLTIWFICHLPFRIILLCMLGFVGLL